MKKFKHFSAMLLIILMVAVFSVLLPNLTRAADLTGMSSTMTRLQQSTDSDHVIAFTTATALTAGQTIKIQFDAAGDAFTIKGTLDDADIVGTGMTVVNACGGGSDEVTVTTDTAAPDENITFTVCAGDTVGAGAKSLTISNGEITNPATPGTFNIDLTTSSDSGVLSVVIVSDDTVTVTATVDPSLTFSISDTTIGFGTLSAASARFANGAGTGSGTEVEAHTLVAGTNATGGYSITANGTTLTSGASDTITAIGGSNTASSPGSEQYGIRATASGGIGTVTAPYAAAGFALDTGAFPDEIASAAGASSDTTFSLRYLANIASNTEAGSYSSDMTYIATATF